MNAKHRIAAIGLPILSALSMPAIAADGKSYPGALCQTESPTAQVVRDAAGRLFNPSSVSQSVICPVVRDVGGAAGISSADTFVIDRNPDVDFSCTTFSRSELGNAVASKADSAGAGFASATPSQLFVSSVASVAGGYYYIRCSIPGVFGGIQSGIVTYGVNEN